MKEKWRLYKSVVVDFAIGVVLWLLIATFVGQGRQIPSPSMLPTIQVGDRVWTDKLVLRFDEIRRGDLVVFDPPPALQSRYPFIKRVIGLPGETIEVRDGKVWINGEPLAEPYVAEPMQYEWGPVEIPEGHYVVMGDNRNYSNDSHEWGFLPRERITARAVFRFWPLSRFGPIE